ncbi:MULTISPECIES: transcriptional regulator [unclassified Bradyrhizobium]|uniref:transcriptional regulator n=1 Tax=unclassified Bradyrhizobium TaxID=2631580 RepID=UPI001FF6FEA6|nr:MULTISPECIES: transcriptional regulator [unclassified Bradyrhizobium]MCK1710070.1 transcriptional regulator [Bradyrhizobium sp. 143]MCK1729928.1 transcriptional regulator [Bradyrhizobium sp. 142]
MRPERQRQIWRSEAGSRRWLSGLIAAMEQAARPEIRREPVGTETLAQLQAHLAVPAASKLFPVSRLRH